MRLVGLTGGIASGKSLVTGELRRLGAQVLDADEIYHQLLGSSEPLRDALRTEFGAQYFDANGLLERKKLGVLVFSDKSALERLNRIAHPFVIDEIWERVDACMIDGVGDGVGDVTVFLSVPLLFETRLDEMVDDTVVVYTPPAVQCQRLAVRDRIPMDAAQLRLDAQWPIDQKRDRATIVIDNSGSV